MALLAKYQRLTQVYSAAIGEMVPRRLSPGDYADLSATAEKARQAAVAARDRLNRHVAEHGC
jgi:hypothetical protein